MEPIRSDERCRSGLAAILALCASALSAGASAPAHSETFLVGHLPLTTQTEEISAELGSFKKVGLDVEVKSFKDGPAAIQGLLSRDLQTVEAGVVPMVRLATQGVPVYFLASTGTSTPENPLGAIMVRRDEGTIKSFSDLMGKKIGQLGRGVNTDMWLRDAAAHFGMKHDDFREILVPFPQMGGLLASKQVDAVYAYAPFDTLISLSGQGRLLMDDAAWVPYSGGSGITVRRDWADAHPDLVIKFVEAAIMTNRWMDDHPEEARPLIGTALKLPPEVSEKMRLPYFARNGFMNMPAMWNMYYSMIDIGELKPVADPKTMFDAYWTEPARRFVLPALKELGKEPDPVVERALTTQFAHLPAPVAGYTPDWMR